MNSKLPIVFRALIGVGFLLLFAGGLSTKPVLSADTFAPNLDPTLTLNKIVITDNGGIATDVNFQAYIDADAVAWNSAHTLTPGTYTVSEVANVPGYSASDWSGDCAADGSITLAADENKNCSITNDDIPPSLTLTKLVTNNDGGTAVPTDWTLTATGPTTISGAGGASSDGSFVAGTYTLSESAGPAGYTSGPWSCSGDGVQVGNEITLAINETATCTITSNDVGPELTIVKNPTNDNGFTALPDDFNLTVGGVGVTSGASIAYVANTPYAINETPVAGYRFVSITGDPKCPTSLGGTITMAPGDVITCTITNNDIGINIDPTSGLLTSESGLPTASFTVVLDAVPTDNVSLTLLSSDTTEGTIDKSSLTFTPANWFLPQTVTITGVDDFIADGPQPYNISITNINSSDLDYGGLNPLDFPKVNVTNADNDSPGISTSPSTDLWTSEGGATEKVQVLLQSQPTSPVMLTIVSSDLGEGTVSENSLTFNPNPWPPPSTKEFTITGVDDCDQDGDVPYTVTITASSADLDYNGTSIDLQVTNYEAPTIDWVEPVETDGIYGSDGFTPIELEVVNLCGEPISKVRFYRWVASIGDHVTIGEDLTPPYKEILNPKELESGWNQVFAFAFGPPNPVQTFSEHKRILILKDYNHLVHLPLIYKKP